MLNSDMILYASPGMDILRVRYDTQSQALEDLTPGVYFIGAGQGGQVGLRRLVVTR